MNRPLSLPVKSERPLLASLLGRARDPLVALVRYLAVSQARYLLLSIAMGLFFGSYFVVRYGGYWAEQDSQFFTFAIIRLIRAGGILYGESYAHGFAYPSWAASLSMLSGVDVGELLRVYTPVLGNLLLALFGYATFRRLLNSDRLGSIATLTLFLVPELIFTVSRGNHEKLTISLTLFAVLVVLRSFQAMMHSKGRVYSGWVLMFYLAATGLVTTNIIFGSAVLFAWTVLFGAIRLFSWLPHMDRPLLRRVSQRLGLLSGTAWILCFFMVWYFYPPAQFGVDLLNGAVERVFGLDLGTSTDGGELYDENEEPVNPYATIQRDWVNPSVYNALTSFRWVLLAGSALTWIAFFLRFLFRPRSLTLQKVVLLGLYGAFALQVAVGVVVDLTGAAGNAANLQVRLFTYFTLFAVPLLVLGIASLRGLLVRWLPGGLVQTALSLAIVFFMAASLLKASLDPLVSNNWIFYNPLEIEAINTWALHSTNRSLYIGPEYRLWFAWVMTYPGGFHRENIPDLDAQDAISAHVLHSPIKDARAGASLNPLSPVLLENQVYDNGLATVYHRTPRTPFQP